MNRASTNENDCLVIAEGIELSRNTLRQLAKRYHIRKLSLFGSAARGEMRPNSDIDLLIEFEPGKAPSLGGLAEIQDVFSKLLGGRKVDLATPSILTNPFRRRSIEQDIETIYAA